MLIDMACGSKSDTTFRLRHVHHNDSGFYPSARFKSWLILRLTKSPIYGRKAWFPPVRGTIAVLLAG